MAQPSDVRGMPGELVILRSSTMVDVRDEPSAESKCVGQASWGMLGLILSEATRGWTYVLWSGHTMVMGWMPDGALRRLNQRG